MVWCHMFGDSLFLPFYFYYYVFLILFSFRGNLFLFLFRIYFLNPYFLLFRIFHFLIFFYFLISHSLFSTPNDFGGGINYPQIGIMLAHFFFLSLCTSVWVSRFSSLGRQRIADWRRCTSQYQPNEKLGSGDQREVEPSSAGFFIITVSGISSS